MHTLFFYAARDSEPSQRAARLLSTMFNHEELIILPSGSQFTAPSCLAMRSNDILILFAADLYDFNMLMALQDEYDSFRIVLMISSLQQLAYVPWALLRPRFVFSLEQPENELEQYIKNALRSNINIHPTKNHEQFKTCRQN